MTPSVTLHEIVLKASQARFPSKICQEIISKGIVKVQFILYFASETRSLWETLKRSLAIFCTRDPQQHHFSTSVITIDLREVQWWRTLQNAWILHQLWTEPGTFPDFTDLAEPNLDATPKTLGGKSGTHFGFCRTQAGCYTPTLQKPETQRGTFFNLTWDAAPECSATFRNPMVSQNEQLINVDLVKATMPRQNTNLIWQTSNPAFGIKVPARALSFPRECCK